jgi:hypothetical protein
MMRQRNKRTKSKIKKANIKFFNTSKKQLNLIKGVSQTPMKHISKKLQPTDEPMDMSHFLHDGDFQQGSSPEEEEPPHAKPKLSPIRRKTLKKVDKVVSPDKPAVRKWCK